MAASYINVPEGEMANGLSRGTSKNLSRARARLHALKGGEGGAGEPLGRGKRRRTGGSKAVAVAVDSVERDLGDSFDLVRQLQNLQPRNVDGVIVVAGAGAEGDQVPAAAVAAAEGDAGAAQGQEHHQVRQGADRGRPRADEQSESVACLINESSMSVHLI